LYFYFQLVYKLILIFLTYFLCWCRFFVVANANASLHNLVMIAMDVLGPQYDYKGLRLVLIAILDMVP